MKLGESLCEFIGAVAVALFAAVLVCAWLVGVGHAWRGFVQHHSPHAHRAH